mmetsp:Transcript_17740/g.38808  ORF Transcript_17740/g.38808 Transcript_17740/m.38808 type:complete len:80 (+) Transcript_17740:196-435(+)
MTMSTGLRLQCEMVLSTPQCTPQCSRCVDLLLLCQDGRWLLVHVFDARIDEACRLKGTGFAVDVKRNGSSNRRNNGTTT